MPKRGRRMDHDRPSSILHFPLFSIIIATQFSKMEGKKGQKRKYVLFKKNEDGSGPKQCAFFSSDAGCRSGSSCRFLHSKDGASFPTLASSQTQPLVVAASKEYMGIDMSPQIVPTGRALGSSQKKAKRSAPRADEEDEDSSSLLFGAVNVALNEYTPVTASLKRTDKRNGEKKSTVKGITPEVLENGEAKLTLSSSGTRHVPIAKKSLQKNLNVNFYNVSNDKLNVPSDSAIVEFANNTSANRLNGAARGDRAVGMESAPSLVKNNVLKNEDKLLEEALGLVTSSREGKVPQVSKPKSLSEILHPEAMPWQTVIELTRSSAKYEKDYTFPENDSSWCSSQLGHGYICFCVLLLFQCI